MGSLLADAVLTFEKPSAFSAGSEDEDEASPNSFDFSFAFNNADFADRVVKLHVVPEEDLEEGQVDDRARDSLRDSCGGGGSSSSSSGGGDDSVARSWSPSLDLGHSALHVGEIRPGSPDSAGVMATGGSPVAGGGDETAVGVGGGAILPQALPPQVLPPATPVASLPAVLKPVAIVPVAPPLPRTVSLHLSSVILAAKSSFFRTLFTCGLKEHLSSNNPVVLTVTPDEEGPVTNLLRFIYTGDMLDMGHEPDDIIKMFLVADKFGVASGMKICLERLASLPMTVATACLYLSLPDSMHAHRGVAQLLDVSKAFLVAHFRDLEKLYKQQEFLELPAVGLQTLLASDDLNVRDEVTAFVAMLEWVRHHHHDIESRRRAAARLAEHVRFPLMAGDELEDVVLKAPETDSAEVAALVKEAAWFRSYSLVRRLRLMNDAPHRRFWLRNWNRNSVGCVYFDIHLDRFQNIAVAATVESAIFGIGGKRFYLSARHGRREDLTETLDIHLHLENSHSVHPEIQVSFIFYAKRWPEGQFDYLRDRVTKGFGRNASNWGYSHILGRPWAEVVQDDSKYFHNGVMSVFAEVQLLEPEGGGKGACTGS